jgi:GNAT superfamily N-acetyltransferase
MLRVKRMKSGDFSFAVELANTMNWNMANEDFEFNLQLEPEGCFVLFDGTEPVGISTCISYGKVGWFGNLIVKENYRRKGAGTILVQTAIDYLKKTGTETIGLYAYTHLVDFYEKLGFKADQDFVVLRGVPNSSTFNDATKRPDFQRVPSVVALDNQCFGADRSRLLKPILDGINNPCYVHMDGTEISGFVTAKVYQGMAELGPLVCHKNRADTAIGLIHSILGRLRHLDVSMCVSRKAISVLDNLSKKGFREDFRLVRMFLGPVAAKNCIYIAESLERG